MTGLYWAAAVLALFAAVHAAARLRRGRPLTAAAPVVCPLALGTALALAAAVPAALQAQPGVPAAWISGALVILATWTYAGFLVAAVVGIPPSREVLVLPALAALSFGALPLGLDAARGAAAVPSGAPALFIQLAVLSYYWPALGRVTVLSWRYSCRVRAAYGGAGMRAVSVAAAVALTVVLAKVAIAVTQLCGTDATAVVLTAANTGQAVAAIGAVAGATAGAWFPAAAAALRQGRFLWAYWRLRQLWAMLRQAVPQVELPAEPGTWRGVRYRLLRRVVEIRDAELALRPYWSADISDRASAVAVAGGLSADMLTATAEAAGIVSALDARKRGADPVRDGNLDGQRLGARADSGLLAEARRLILVARAVRHLRRPAAPHLLRTTAVIRAIGLFIQLPAGR